MIISLTTFGENPSEWRILFSKTNNSNIYQLRMRSFTKDEIDILNKEIDEKNQKEKIYPGGYFARIKDGVKYELNLIKKNSTNLLWKIDDAKPDMGPSDVEPFEFLDFYHNINSHEVFIVYKEGYTRIERILIDKGDGRPSPKDVVWINNHYNLGFTVTNVTFVENKDNGTIDVVLTRYQGSKSIDKVETYRWDGNKWTKIVKDKNKDEIDSSKKN